MAQDLLKLKIEKNIPITRPPGRAPVYPPIAKQMEVGDSVLLKERNQAQCLIVAIKNINRKAVLRKQKNGGFRVWRTK